MNLFQFDSRIEYFFNMIQELNLLFYVTRWIEPLFSLTQRIELFFLSRNMTQRIEFFLSRNTTQRIEPSFQQMTQRIQHDSKDWTSFFLFQINRKNCINFEICLKELNPLKKDSKNWTLFSVWLKELNPLFENVSMNWTFV